MTDESGWTDAELRTLRLEGLDRLTHLLSGNATESDAADLILWRMRSRAHEEAFRAAIRLRGFVQVADDRDPSMSDDPSSARVLPFVRPIARSMTRRHVLAGTIAASVVGGGVIAGDAIDLLPSPVELAADYSTGAGERRLVRLGPHATIALNTRTGIDVRYGSAMPTVELLRGEALVTSTQGDVALVAANGVSIGRSARFNARRDGNEMCITCLTGIVDIDSGGQRRRLAANAQVRYDLHGIGRIARDINAATIAAWKSGTLIFRNMPFPTVVREINRYRAGRVILATPSLADRTLSGTYYVNRLDEFFDQVQLAFGVHIIRLPGNIVILT